MAYLTQYSNSVPVIKYHIEQTLMTIGKDIDMDICVPEDGIAENHAAVEAIKYADSYRFTIKSSESEASLELNGEAVSRAELQDGDWLVIGGVEFKFTDDGVNSIAEEKTTIPAPVIVATPKPEPLQKTQNNESEALKLIKGLKEELQDDVKPLTTKEFIANSRSSRRRLAF
ncbi:MAG: FHA domain-containing protein [Gammaproteobacteria bacterium]|nr:FHA domain-containing protein [Gammaproteobacteria bacterium]